MDDILEVEEAPRLRTSRLRRAAPVAAVATSVGVILAVWSTGGGAANASNDSPTKVPSVFSTFGTPDGTAPEFGTSVGTGPQKGGAIALDPEHAKQLSSCMRSNGYPSFPEPDAQGRISFTSEDGFDIDDPAFSAAMEKCDPISASMTPEQKAQAKAEAQKVSDCMQGNGVPSFPDPSADGKLMVKAGPGTDLDPSSETFQQAQAKCQPGIPTPPAGTPSGPDTVYVG